MGRATSSFGVPAVALASGWLVSSSSEPEGLSLEPSLLEPPSPLVASLQHPWSSFSAYLVFVEVQLMTDLKNSSSVDRLAFSGVGKGLRHEPAFCV
jgi:hypothetical protein